jgi:Helix-turn-helix domain
MINFNSTIFYLKIKKIRIFVFYRGLSEEENILKLFIKNMVCIRCQMVVKSELEKLGMNFSAVELGEVEIIGKVSKDQLDNLSAALKLTGLELMEDNKTILVEKIKTLIIELIHYSDEQIKINLSDYLSEKLANKIERVKELLVYDELNLTEIAWKLHYSSVSHLSNQFKKMTGLTPSHFKNLKNKKRSPLGGL